MSTENQNEFFLGWYGKKVATLSYNGATFGFDYDSGWLLPLESYERKSGELPQYLFNLMPGHILGSTGPEALKMMAATLGSRERFLANLCVVKDHALLSSMIEDRLGARLANCRDSDGVFTGIVSPDLSMSRETVENIDDVIVAKRITQFSGSQTKLATNLGDDGTLRISTGLPSTHIVKYSGFGGDTHHLRGAMEWACMEMARSGGVNTAEFALIEMHGADGPQLNYLTERFDIPSGPEDGRIIFCEELGGALNLPPMLAAQSKLKDIIEPFAELSTRPREDMEHLMRQLVANVIMENGDFHSRNLAVLKVATPSLSGWRSTRLAPAYDMMYTRPFSTSPIADDVRETPRMSINVYERGSTEPVDLFSRMNFNGFAAAAEMMQMSQDRAREIVEQVATGMLDRAESLLQALPPVFERHPGPAKAVIEAVNVVADNSQDLLRSLDPPVRPRGPR